MQATNVGADAGHHGASQPDVRGRVRRAEPSDTGEMLPARDGTNTAPLLPYLCAFLLAFSFRLFGFALLPALPARRPSPPPTVPPSIVDGIARANRQCARARLLARQRLFGYDRQVLREGPAVAAVVSVPSLLDGAVCCRSRSGVCASPCRAWGFVADPPKFV